jgi:hypothetical protein
MPCKAEPGISAFERVSFDRLKPKAYLFTTQCGIEPTKMD